MDLQELVLLEQLLKTFPRDLEVWLKEQKPSCTAKVAEMADDYEVVRGSKGVPSHLESTTTGRYQFQVAGASSSTSSLKTTQKPGTFTRSGPGQPSTAFQPQRSRTNHRGEIQCHWCKEWGHIAAVCPQRQLHSGVNATSRPAYLSTDVESGCGDRFVKDAKLDGKPIRILLDTGSKMSIVRADLVSQARWKMDDRMPIQCIQLPTCCSRLMDGVEHFRLQWFLRCQ